MAESKVASVNRAGGFVSFSLTSTASTLADSLGATGTIGLIVFAPASLP